MYLACLVLSVLLKEAVSSPLYPVLLHMEVPKELIDLAVRVHALEAAVSGSSSADPNETSDSTEEQNDSPYEEPHLIGHKCPTEAIRASNGGCYSIHGVEFGKIIWEEAKSFCEKKGGRLAIIKTKKDVQSVWDAYEGYSKTKTVGKTLFPVPWIGLAKTNGKWIWQDGAMELQLTEKYMKGFPPYFGNCGVLDITGVDGFTCNSERPWICEWPIKN